MKLGAIVPQGWTGEYDGREAPDAWARTVAVARQAAGSGTVISQSTRCTT